jgi:hypothetical protein
MNTVKHAKVKKNLSLSRRQRDILVGLLLGDGHLETQNGGRTYRLKVEHGMKQKDYVLFLYEEFKEWIPGGVYEKKRRDGSMSVGFTTFSHPSVRFYGQQFYPHDGKKRIPKSIASLLSSLGIAIWFMDDGSRKSLRHTTYIIHTLGYTKRDLERMIHVLQETFSISATLHSQKGRYWRIYIPSESRETFESLIVPTVERIPSMRGKLATQMPKE